MELVCDNCGNDNDVGPLLYMGAEAEYLVLYCMPCREARATNDIGTLEARRMWLKGN